MIILSLTFWVTDIPFYIAAAPFYINILPTDAQGFQILHILTNTWCFLCGFFFFFACFLFTIAILMGVKWDFDLHFPMMCDIEHLFMWLLAIHILSLEKHLFRSFAHFWNGLFSDCSLLVCGNATDFCMLTCILLLHWIHLLVLTAYVCVVVRVFYIQDHIICKQR